MLPKKSLLDDMKQEAEEMFGDDDDDMDGEDCEGQDYEEEMDDEQEGNDMDDDMADEDDAPKKSVGMRRLLSTKRKREPEIVADEEDDFVC